MPKPPRAVTPWGSVVALVACLTLACGGNEGGAVPCVQLSAAPQCAADGRWPRPPSPLLEATQIGEGVEFVSLNAAMALARGPDAWWGIYMNAQRSPPLAAFEIRLPGPGGVPPDVVLDLWHGELPGERAQVLVLACLDQLCGLYRGREVDERGLPTSWLELWEPLRPEWEARGIVDFWPHETQGYSICVHGRGISCRTNVGAWETVLAPEVGLVRAVSSHLALTDTGVLLAARREEHGIVQLPVEWTEVPSREPLVRVSEAGAFSSSGLWLKEAGPGFSSCEQRPVLLAGTPPLDALDENGTAFSRQTTPSGEYLPCKWPGTIDGPVLGEAYVACGLSRSWVVLTPERILAMHGGLSCAVK